MFWLYNKTSRSRGLPVWYDQDSNDKKDDDKTNGGGKPSNDDRALHILESIATRLAADKAPDQAKELAALHLAKESIEHRRELKRLRTLLETANNDLKTYKDMGKVEEIQAKLKAHDELKAKVAQHDEERLHAQVAPLAGYGNVEVLTDLIRSKGIHVEVRTETVDGKPVQKAYARKASDTNAPLVLLSDYVATHHKAYEPALKTGVQSTTSTGETAVPPHGPPTGTPAGDDPVAKFLAAQDEARKKQKSPLESLARSVNTF